MNKRLVRRRAAIAIIAGVGAAVLLKTRTSLPVTTVDLDWGWTKTYHRPFPPVVGGGTIHIASDVEDMGFGTLRALYYRRLGDFAEWLKVRVAFNGDVSESSRARIEISMLDDQGAVLMVLAREIADYRASVSAEYAQDTIQPGSVSSARWELSPGLFASTEVLVVKTKFYRV